MDACAAIEVDFLVGWEGGAECCIYEVPIDKQNQNNTQSKTPRTVCALWYDGPARDDMKPAASQYCN
jgi:hypothetical protein